MADYSDEYSLRPYKTYDPTNEQHIGTLRDRLLKLPDSIAFINNIKEFREAIVRYYKKIEPLLCPEYKFEGNASTDKGIDTIQLRFFIPYDVGIDDFSKN